VDKKQRTSERRMKLVDTTRGNVMRNLREKEDHHLELDHCGKKEKLKIEKLPKSATSASAAGNDYRGESKHVIDSL